MLQDVVRYVVFIQIMLQLSIMMHCLIVVGLFHLYFYTSPDILFRDFLILLPVFGWCGIV